MRAPGAQPAAAPASGCAQPERATFHTAGGGSFFGGSSFSFIGPPPARLLQPHVGLWGMSPVQLATPLIELTFPREPSFVSFESTTTTTLFVPPPQPTWPALGPAATTADTEAKTPIIPAAVGLDDATLDGNYDAWIEAIDAAILELGLGALVGAVA